ncbi:MAG: radical SAM family heme chaperone HemW [Granulosicoccus sp.]
MRRFTELPPLSLYVHLPWCIRKCPYCDFNSHEQPTELPEIAYVDALLDDLAQEMPDVWGRSLSSVFLGGGTPSLFSPKALDRLLSGIRALTGLAPATEITMEANPGTFEQARFADFRAIGINRLSIGIQSFNDAALEALGRVHSAREALSAIEIAQSAGFERINLDLMFGLPGQSVTDSIADVDQAIALTPGHVSCYELTLEPNTLFARYPPAVPDDEQRWKMQCAIVEQLAVAGYERYEISAYAQSGKRCQHNLNYWLFGDYIGIGAGAHGKISAADTGTIVRRWKQKHPARYLDTAATDERIGAETELPVEDTGLEFMMNALRLTEGFPIPLFQHHTGVVLDQWQPAIDTAIESGLLVQQGLNLRPTPQGSNFLNDLLAHFLNNQTPTKARYPVIPLHLDP